MDPQKKILRYRIIRRYIEKARVEMVRRKLLGLMPCAVMPLHSDFLPLTAHRLPLTAYRLTIPLPSTPSAGPLLPLRSLRGMSLAGLR